jgi:hypothetical protein
LWRKGKLWGESDGWGPKEKSPAPKSDWNYTELEAARFWGYNVGQWLLEDRHVKNIAVAHYLEHNTREAFTAERHREQADKDKAREHPTTDFSKFSQRKVL